MKSFALFMLAALAVAEPTVYLIRHGEKPDDGGNGLSDQGKQRAECIRSVFGASSSYNIGKIMAQEYKESGKRKRPYDTVLPLATDLGLEVDTSCDRDDEDCVQKAVENYNGSGNVLICWEHSQLDNIAEELGAKKIDEYPDDRYDLIWTLPSPYGDITAETSESCPGLDS